MFRISVVLLSYVFACDGSLNDPITGINPDCNNAGICSELSTPFGTISECECCKPKDLDPNNECADHWVCDPQNPSEACVTFDGPNCESIEEYLYVSFGFRFDLKDSALPPDIECRTDPYNRATYNVFLNQTVNFVQQVEHVAAMLGYNATIMPSPSCDTCSVAHPCTVGTDGTTFPTQGYTFGFQADYNVFYDPSCSTGSILMGPQFVPECDANYDYGQRAFEAWTVARGAGDTTFINELNDLLSAEADVDNNMLGLGWSNSYAVSMSDQVYSNDIKSVTSSPTFSPTDIRTPTPTFSPTNSPSPNPTFSPTPNPTFSPTTSPTPTPTFECGPYSNNVNDLSYLGVGTNCRGGLNSSWPGGLTCDSPYVVCLPKENTPAAFRDQDYKNSTHRYSVDECLQECANDQRCSGVEFVADNETAVGDCNLIDDIPVVITQGNASSFNYDSSITYMSLDRSVTGADALCFQKEGHCNPYFEAEDLNSVMLDCYCPNNRKGFYTKKVKRTVANSRFCGNDTEVDTRIQKAQANRMFHLCENWCLFLTENPEAESWYYDPWNECYREQYAGVGVHMSYCNRVIRSPDTIEMQFVNSRVELSCQPNITSDDDSFTSPSQWYMADEGDSCDDRCTKNGQVCDEKLTASVVPALNSTALDYFMAALGYPCSKIEVGEVDWALPGVQVSTGTCFLRNNATEISTGCNWAIGLGYKRLCACNSNL